MTPTEHSRVTLRFAVAVVAFLAAVAMVCRSWERIERPSVCDYCAAARP